MSGQAGPALLGSTPSAAPPAQALIGFGQVRHERLRPAGHAFAYPTAFLMLPLRSLRAQGSGALARNRAALLSFHDRDHGQGGDDCLAWLDELLASQGLSAPGEVWLHTYPRMFGYTFKPVSFWYCQDALGQLAAIVVEVNNTFGERHCYLLEAPRYGHVLEAPKAFHVSPFAVSRADTALRSCAPSATVASAPLRASITTMPKARCSRPAWQARSSP